MLPLSSKCMNQVQFFSRTDKKITISPHSQNNFTEQFPLKVSNDISVQGTTEVRCLTHS